jgi:tRNA G46 methylase TrmB
VHPQAKIIERRVDEYPIYVKIMTEDGTVVFNTDQRNLFSKNAQKRKDSIERIKKVVQGL